MSNRCGSFVMGAVAVFLCFQNIHADQDHTCSNHKSFFFGCPGFKSYGPWKGVEKISVVSVEEIVYQEDNDNCSCGDASWSKVTKSNVTHKIGVTGEVTVGLKNGLATALIAKANATVKMWHPAHKQRQMMCGPIRKGILVFAIKKSPRVHQPDGQGDVEFSRVLDRVLDFRVTIQ